MGKNHLQGLFYIRLEDALPELDNRADDWARRAVEEGMRVYGWYASRERSEEPHIVLYVDEIYRSLPSFLWWSSLPTLRIARSLAHETGHHLAATRGFVLKPGEDLKEEESLANLYAASVLKRMRSRWWYRFGQWCLKDIAGWHYSFGCADWRAMKFARAAESFYKAWDLDPDNQDALYWYWRSRERLTRSVSPQASD